MQRIQLSEYDVSVIVEIIKNESGHVNFIGGVEANLREILPHINAILHKKYETYNLINND